MRNFLVLIGLLLALNLYAEETSLSTRTYINSCGYFSNFAADFRASLNDVTLPQDTQVKLIYGLGSLQEKTDWQFMGEIKAKKVQATTWQAETTITLAQRGYPYHFNTLQFVWKIELSSGQTFYVKGNNSTLGFFEAMFSTIHESRCVSGSEGKPLYRKVNLHSVER